MLKTPTAVQGADWAINLRLLLPATARLGNIYRSAAPDWRTPDLATPPGQMLWIDLRAVSEYRGLGNVPQGWDHLALDVMAAQSGSRATVETGMAELASGEISFGTIYCGLLNTAGAMFAEAVTAIARSEGDTVIACTAGRDRTGVLSTLLLSLAGTSHEHIVADYLRTNNAATALNSLVPTGTALDLTVRAADIEMALAHLGNLGGARRYLLDAGLAPEHLNAFLPASPLHA